MAGTKENLGLSESEKEKIFFKKFKVGWLEKQSDIRQASELLPGEAAHSA